MKLNNLSITNLFSFEEDEIDFSKLSNKIFICGMNNDVGGMDSNGSGKTSIFNSIYWVLYGKTLDKREGDEVIRKGEEACIGVIQIGGYMIKRLQSKNSKMLSLSNNLEHIKASTNTKTQEIIDEVLGCDYKAFKHSHYLSSDFSDAFIGKGTTPKERFEVFEKFIDSDTLNKCKKFCEDRIKEIKDKKLSLEGEYVAYLKIIEDGEDKEELENKLNYINFELSKISISLKEINENISKIENKRDAWLKSQSNEKTKEKLESLKIQKNDLDCIDIPPDKKDNIERLKEILNELKYVKSLKELICPECNTHLFLDDNKLKKIEDKIIKESDSDNTNELKEELRMNEAEQRVRVDILIKIESITMQIDSLKGTLSTDSKTVEFNEEEYSDLKGRLYDLQKKENELVVEKDVTENEINRIEKAGKFIKANINNMAGLNTEMSKYLFWKDGYQNIKISRISTIIPLFESETNNILSNTFDCDMSVIFKTTKELKSGGIRNELNIYVNTTDEEMRSFESLSMGEQGRVAIAVTLARNTIFSDKSNLDFILIDELLDGLDSTGQQFLIDIINKLPQQVLIISHSDVFKNQFTDTITVEKTNGVSRIC